MKTLYIECKMGAAGDMLMAALYELLDDRRRQEFLGQMNTMFGQDIQLHAEVKTVSGISGTHMHVRALGQEEASDSIPHTHSDTHTHSASRHSHDNMHSLYGHLNSDTQESHTPGHENAHTYEHGYTHDHKIEHTHEHEYNAHDHEIAAHTHEYKHKYEHAHDHENGHTHEHRHLHKHENTHTHEHEHHHAHHSYPSIIRQIHTLPVTDEVRTHAGAVYRMIGEAEAKVHQTTLEQIHFHEVGSLDALADVVGCCLLLSMLQPEQIVVSPVHAGNGTVRCAHGILPVPAPATAEILKGIPYYTGTIDSELCTPTGAALLRHFADRFGSMPAMSVTDTGVGHGTKKFPVLNAVRTFLGETMDSSHMTTEEASDRIVDISCNLDDMTGEALGYCMELLFDAGALDVFYIPVQMKKNRPGILLHCLCQPEQLDSFCQLILRHTTTRGVRFQYFNRRKLSSHIENTETGFGTVRRKVSEGGRIAKAKYEFEDLKRIADEQGLSLYELLNALSSQS